jgi:hypothetical protein
MKQLRSYKLTNEAVDGFIEYADELKSAANLCAGIFGDYLRKIAVAFYEWASKLKAGYCTDKAFRGLDKLYRNVMLYEIPAKFCNDSNALMRFVLKGVIHIIEKAESLEFAIKCAARKC